MGAKHEKVSVERLKGLKVLFEDDLYQLGLLILKGHDAVDAQTNCRSRTTLHGLAGKFASLFYGSRITAQHVEEIIRSADLPIGGTIEHDGDCRRGKKR
jgi:hypothetical protein